MNDQERSAQLWLLFDSLLAVLVEAVKSGEAKAAMLEVARQFLLNNDITLTGTASLADGLEALAARRTTKLPFDA